MCYGVIMDSSLKDIQKVVECMSQVIIGIKKQLVLGGISEPEAELIMYKSLVALLGWQSTHIIVSPEEASNDVLIVCKESKKINKNISPN